MRARLRIWSCAFSGNMRSPFCAARSLNIHVLWGRFFLIFILFALFCFHIVYILLISFPCFLSFLSPLDWVMCQILYDVTLIYFFNYFILFIWLHCFYLFLNTKCISQGKTCYRILVLIYCILKKKWIKLYLYNTFFSLIFLTFSSLQKNKKMKKGETK